MKTHAILLQDVKNLFVLQFSETSLKLLKKNIL